MSKKFILLALGVILAIVFGGISFGISNKSKASSDNSVAQFDKMVSQYADIEAAMYENGSATGAEIIDLINGMNGDTTYSVVVKNGANQSYGSSYSNGVTYSYGSSKFNNYIEYMTDPGDDDFYINSTATFDSDVERDVNGVIVSIIFTQKGVR